MISVVHGSVMENALELQSRSQPQPMVRVEGEWMQRNTMHAGWKIVELGTADWTGVAFGLGRVGNFSQSESRSL